LCFLFWSSSSLFQWEIQPLVHQNLQIHQEKLHQSTNLKQTVQYQHIFIVVKNKSILNPYFLPLNIKVIYSTLFIYCLLSSIDYQQVVVWVIFKSLLLLLFLVYLHLSPDVLSNWTWHISIYKNHKKKTKIERIDDLHYIHISKKRIPVIYIYR
jgi:hypothetical protein